MWESAVWHVKELYIPSSKIWNLYAALACICRLILTTNTAEIHVSQCLLLTHNSLVLFQTQLLPVHSAKKITWKTLNKLTCFECLETVVDSSHCVSILLCPVQSQSLWWDLECWMCVFAQMWWKRWTTRFSAVPLAPKLIFCFMSKHSLLFLQHFFSDLH